jgi:hypothetical protein
MQLPWFCRFGQLGYRLVEAVDGIRKGLGVADQDGELSLDPSEAVDDFMEIRHALLRDQRSQGATPLGIAFDMLAGDEVSP